MESGCIRVAEFSDAGAHGAVLPAKGVEVMNLVPETIGGKKNEKTIGSIVSEGIKTAEPRRLPRLSAGSCGRGWSMLLSSFNRSLPVKGLAPRDGEAGLSDTTLR